MTWRLFDCQRTFVIDVLAHFFVIDVLALNSYDLDSVAGSQLALLASLLRQNTKGVDVDALWSKIVLAVQASNQNAGTLALSTIPQAILSDYSDTTFRSAYRDLLRLSEHGKVILDNIRTDISGVHVDRKLLSTSRQTKGELL